MLFKWSHSPGFVTTRSTAPHRKPKDHMARAQRLGKITPAHEAIQARAALRPRKAPTGRVVFAFCDVCRRNLEGLLSFSHIGPLGRGRSTPLARFQSLLQF